MDKEVFLNWINQQIIDLESERDHAIKFDNYGKAAELQGQILGTQKVLSRVQLGDFN